MGPSSHTTGRFAAFTPGLRLELGAPITLLRRANPGAVITEEHVRRALRSGDIEHPPMFAGRLVWSFDQVEVLARHLGLNRPYPSSWRVSGNDSRWVLSPALEQRLMTRQFAAAR